MSGGSLEVSNPEIVVDTKASAECAAAASTSRADIWLEIHRVSEAIIVETDPQRWAALFSIQQSLLWVVCPNVAASPVDVVLSGRVQVPTGIPVKTTDCSADLRPSPDRETALGVDLEWQFSRLRFLPDEFEREFGKRFPNSMYLDAVVHVLRNTARDMESAVKARLAECGTRSHDVCLPVPHTGSSASRS